MTLALRVLANENVSGDVVEGLRASGHDLAWIGQSAPGSADESVLQMARSSQRRELVTFDKDSDELVLRRGGEASCGVVLLRIDAPSAGKLARLVVQAIDSRQDWAGHFSVVESGRVGMLWLR